MGSVLCGACESLQVRSWLHFIRFLFGLDQPDSQLTVDEVNLLLKYAGNAHNAVEIGCYEGRTTVALAKRVQGSVYTVDPFIRGRLGIPYGEWIAKLHSRRMHVRNIEFIRGLSWDIAPGFKQDIDLLFIDADHTYEAIKKDWELWSPKVVSGGIIALHDCKIAPNSPIYLGSMQFYEEDIKMMSHITEVDSSSSLVVLRVN